MPCGSLCGVDWATAAATKNTNAVTNDNDILFIFPLLILVCFQKLCRSRNRLLLVPVICLECRHYWLTRAAVSNESSDCGQKLIARSRLVANRIDNASNAARNNGIAGEHHDRQAGAATLD